MLYSKRQMSGDVLVIGIGNDFRRDDGVGLAVAAELAKRRLPGVRVMTAIGEPASILEAWTGVLLARISTQLVWGNLVN